MNYKTIPQTHSLKTIKAGTVSIVYCHGKSFLSLSMRANFI